VAEAHSRREIALAGLGGAAFAVVIILASSGGDVDRMTFGDGRLIRAVAQDLDADNPGIQSVIASSGAALRYGRIALPAALWTLSAGNASAMRYVQPLIMVLCAAGIAMAGRAIVRGGSVVTAMAPFLAVGLSVSIAGGFAEPLSIVLALWAIVLVQRQRYVPAALLFAASMLARENAAAVLIGLALWEFFHGRRRGAFVLIGAGAPVVAWHLVVADRFGHLPLRDPWLVDTGALGVPVINVLRALGEVGSGGVVLIVAHLIVAVGAMWMWRSSIFGAAAAASALPILSVGTFTWRYLGDAARLTAFLEVLFIIAIIERSRSGASTLRLRSDDPSPEET
jgi:hypothetical protein